MQISYKLIFLIFTLGLLLLIGTFIFHELERWDYIDSFYFSTITLTTIGYGDLHPTQPITKLITSFYALYGVAVVLYLLGLFISGPIEQQEKRFLFVMGRIRSRLNKNQEEIKKIEQKTLRNLNKKEIKKK